MERNLTDQDVEAIVKAIDLHNKSCRFNRVDPTEMEEAVKFVKNFNKAMEDSRGVFRRTVLVLCVGGFAALIGKGILTKIREVLGL
jgi:hypothetical protein